ncbi:unnamed protein product [Microthlaspi erraticum]|uniref:Uncharacterized protein n=1 Tax=Microthlaspi erraticum TaxID=1685480 RepID=A0A6D2I059_9BRAS|nr:unnamed protein product [Microthlaspi erraticum]
MLNVDKKIELNGSEAEVACPVGLNSSTHRLVLALLEEKLKLEEKHAMSSSFDVKGAVKEYLKTITVKDEFCIDSLHSKVEFSRVWLMFNSDTSVIQG